MDNNIKIYSAGMIQCKTIRGGRKEFEEYNNSRFWIDDGLIMIFESPSFWIDGRWYKPQFWILPLEHVYFIDDCSVDACIDAQDFYRWLSKSTLDPVWYDGKKIGKQSVPYDGDIEFE